MPSGVDAVAMDQFDLGMISVLIHEYFEGEDIDPAAILKRVRSELIPYTETLYEELCAIRLIIERVTSTTPPPEVHDYGNRALYRALAPKYRRPQPRYAPKVPPPPPPEHHR